MKKTGAKIIIFSDDSNNFALSLKLELLRCRDDLELELVNPYKVILKNNFLADALTNKSGMKNYLGRLLMCLKKSVFFAFF